MASNSTGAARMGGGGHSKSAAEPPSIPSSSERRLNANAERVAELADSSIKLIRSAFEQRVEGKMRSREARSELPRGVKTKCCCPHKISVLSFILPSQRAAALHQELIEETAVRATNLMKRLLFTISASTSEPPIGEFTSSTSNNTSPIA